jgi:uncharacterized membrane protein YqjE
MADNVPLVGRGLLESLTNFASTLVGVTHTRLNLVSNDLEEYHSHVVAQLVLTQAALFFIGIGVVLATILLVVAFWDTDRLLVLGSLAAIYLVVGLAAGAFAMHKSRARPRPFAASLSELYKDRQQLAPRS